MVKVKCKVCANEVSKICKIKKNSVSLNKARKCKAYVYDESKLRVKKETPSTRFGYKDQQETKRRYKAELKALKEAMKQEPGRGTARDLGLVKPEDEIVLPGDPRFSMPKDTKHPLTGDLSRFTTTAKNDIDSNYKNKI